MQVLAPGLQALQPRDGTTQGAENWDNSSISPRIVEFWNISRSHGWLCRFDTEWKSRGCSNKFLVTHKQVEKLEKNLPNAFFHACRPPRTWKSSGKGLWGQTQSAMARRPRYEFNLFLCILKKRIDFYEMSHYICTTGFHLTAFRWCWVTSTTGRSRRLNVVFEMITMCHRSENLRSNGNN